MKPITKLSEEELVSLLQSKDKKAFDYLYKNYAGALYSVVLRIVSSKEYAEEVIQDVFVKVWKNMNKYSTEKGRFFTWLINIARNTAIDYLKSKSFQNEQKNQELSDFVSNSKEFSLMQNVDFIGMNVVLSGLKQEWRQIIDLSYYQGYTQQEIAEKLDIPLGTVKTRSRNALLALKNLLKEYQ